GVGGNQRAAGGSESADRGGAGTEVVAAGRFHPAVDEVATRVHDDCVAADDGQVERVLARRLPLAIQIDLDRRPGVSAGADLVSQPGGRATLAATGVELQGAAGGLVHPSSLGEQIGNGSGLTREAVQSRARYGASNRHLLARMLCDEQIQLRIA